MFKAGFFLSNDIYNECRVDRRGFDGETWFAQLRLLFSCTRTGTSRAVHELAFVRWYVEAAATSESDRLAMTRLAWAATELPGRRGWNHPHYDVIPISSIEFPVMLQPDPYSDRRQHFLHNPYM